MHVISLSKFRTNQTATLLRALQGESVLPRRIRPSDLPPWRIQTDACNGRGKNRQQNKRGTGRSKTYRSREITSQGRKSIPR